MEIGSISDIEFIKSVWRKKREPVGFLADDFVARFSKFVNWNCVSNNYGLSAPIDIRRYFHHKF